MVPVIEPSGPTLRSCASLSGAASCSTQTLAATALAASAAPATEAVAQPTPLPETAAPEPEPEPAVVWPTMEVREGDTLFALSDWFGLSPFDIAAANYMSADDWLQIGATLAIPVDVSVFSIPPDPLAAPEPVAIVAPPAAPVVTPAPTAPPVPYVPPASSDVIAAICALPWPCEKMVRIATCESNLNPRAVNPIGYYGLFQIDHQFPGWDDAATNASVAYYEKYLPALNRGGDGLSPWPVCQYY